MIMIDNRLLARIAELHFIHGASQYKIAEKFNFSKSKVCRIIKEAKDKGVIEFKIKNFDNRKIELEKKIEDRYGLREAIVYFNSDIPKSDDQLVFQKVGNLGAEYIKRILRDNMNIAVTWGKTLYNVIKEIRTVKNYRINVFSTLGGVGLTRAEYQNNNLVKMLSDKIGGYHYQLYLPLILDKSKYKNLLQEENSIMKVLGDITKLDYYITSFGTVSTDSRMYKLGGFDRNFIKALTKKKVIGEIGLNFYDIEGNFISTKVGEKIVNIKIDDIKKIKNKIIIGFGKEKVKALKGLLETKIPDILITDSITIESVLSD